MRICLFEDRGVSALEPLALTRPAFDLLCGCSSLGDNQFRHFAATARGALVRPWMAEMARLQAPSLMVNDLAWLRSAPVVLVNARWLPGETPAPWSTFDRPCAAFVDGQVAWLYATPDLLIDCCATTFDDWLDHRLQSLKKIAATGKMINYLWDAVDLNGSRIIADVRGKKGANRNLMLVGSETDLHIDPTAKIDPLVVADTTGGPVVVGRDAVIGAFTRLEGPCFIGPGTQVLGAKIRAGTTLGPQCRIGGEVEASIVQGHSNKYHDGFLGHAYVGAWVNLGAGTSNSDLRNDYAEVKVVVDGRLISTGKSKVGCYIGDHAKAALGCLLNTGTNAGVFSGLLPGGLLPKYVPSFASVWHGGLVENTELESLLKTAAKVMSRRGCELTEAHRVLYAEVMERTAGVRRQALREAEQRRLRRSA